MSKVQELKELTGKLVEVLEDLPLDELDTLEESVGDLHDKVDTIETQHEDLQSSCKELEERVEQVESDLGETVGLCDYQRYCSQTEEKLESVESIIATMQTEIDSLKQTARMQTELIEKLAKVCQLATTIL